VINKITDVIIIGAGPSGIACAIQLKRHKIESVVFEKSEIGGLLKNANLVENYLGFPNGISGNKFVQLLKKQTKNNNINIKHETVEIVEFFNNTLNVKTNKEVYHSKHLVIASGTKPILLRAPILREDIQDKVFFEIYKLGQIEHKNIAIIGAGDCAFDYALNLSTNNNVIILNRSKTIKALSILQDRVLKSKNIKYFDNVFVKQINTKNKKLALLCHPNDEIIYSDYLLFAIGREPNLDFINRDLLKHHNVFQIGDVTNGQFRQVSIAIGDGTFTAMKINNILNK